MDIDAKLNGYDLFGEPLAAPRNGELASRFYIPPFSVLNAREGWWQDRKRAWIAIGIRSEVGRGSMAGQNNTMSETIRTLKPSADPAAFRACRPHSGHDVRPGREPGRYTGVDAWVRSGGKVQPGLTWVGGDRDADELDPTSRKNLSACRKPNASPGGSPRPACDYSQNQRGDGSGKAFGSVFGTEGNISDATGTSIFDPVLCELMYRWFAPPGGQVVDPFAGGSVRGIVAAMLGRRYWGCELRPEQVQANEQQRELAPKGSDLRWEVGDAAALLPCGPYSDFLFSCPPYGSLELYSELPGDLSNMGPQAFDAAYADIIGKAVSRMNPDSFACFVVGDYRIRNGGYANLPGKTIAAFVTAGCELYNYAILVTACGSLPLRAGKQFNASRKFGKTHQDVLVFLKGDAKRACSKLERYDVET